MHFASALILSALAVLVVAEESSSPMLSAKATAVIKPLMELRIKQTMDEFTDDGHWKGESKYAKEVDERFEAIINNQSKTGDEAIAYLLTVYTGEHPGEELVCEAINRGARMVPLLKAFEKFVPRIGLEPLPKAVRGSGVLISDALQGIEKGEKCEYE